MSRIPKQETILLRPEIQIINKIQLKYGLTLIDHCVLIYHSAYFHFIVEKTEAEKKKKRVTWQPHIDTHY